MATVEEQIQDGDTVIAYGTNSNLTLTGVSEVSVSDFNFG